MLPFLQSVAQAYSSRFRQDGHPRASEYCFIFPNKRAGTFFRHYLTDLNPQGMIAPEITTISDFTADLSGRIVNSRIDLIFLLYNCYCDMLAPGVPPAEREGVLSFDSFRKWGETVLRDFNEVDMQNVDPEAIFKNVKDFRRISSTFLTEDQRKVMEEYFGYSASRYESDSFWIDFDEENGASDSEIRAKFIHLWKVLAPLYKRFHEAMKERGLTSQGASYRIALDNLREAADMDDGGKALRMLLPWEKIVMVGFNALSMSERGIFRELQRLPSPNPEEEKLTDFIWDATGPVLKDIDNSAGRFVAINRREFPSPEWTSKFLRQSETRMLPEVLEEIAAPSKVMQVKIASQIISEMADDESISRGGDAFREAKVALVVPDESLLLPLLYSLPTNVDKVNLTMGYPLKLTAVSSFLALLRNLQLMQRNSKSYQGFAFEQICDLLSHPFAHAIFSTGKINRFIESKQRQHVRVIRTEHLKELGEKAMEILSPISDNATSREVIKYLDRVLEIIGQTLAMRDHTESAGQNIIKDSLESLHIEAWRDALKIFDDSIREYDVRLSVPATLAEAYRLLQSETVPFDGEPLEGLQIMGMLETRALDFDHLVIVGLNDRTIPGRMRQRSFIPNLIRRGFGMPPNTYQEDLFGYYFFRLISRAKTVKFVYDSRVTGGNGGESRYLLQLRYLYARDKVKRIEYKFSMAEREKFCRSVLKTDEVKKKLERYCDPEPFPHPHTGKPYRFNFSASLLKTFTSCSLKFYYKAILDLKDDPAPSPSVSPILLGNIVHDVMQHLYTPHPEMQKRWIEPIEVSKESIEYFLSDRGREEIDDAIRRLINRNHYHKDTSQLDDPLEIETEIIANNIGKYIEDILKYDYSLAPFNIYGTEIREQFEYTLPNGRKVNMEYALDRVDDVGCDQPGMLRIVDYKTGGSHIKAKSIESLFESDYNKDNLLQLLTYSVMVNAKRKNEGHSPITFLPRIYPVGRLYKMHSSSEKKNNMIPTVDGIELDSDSSVIEEFKDLFDSTLESIFSNAPFEGEVTQKKCGFCPFIGICTS
ncbi:MAG: PD-(D/E)XK nuclease family protein [Muribaculaceae bacterium]|nr:PD-(D/E)XK nuclease family protein [Muribaculaceae bacterium]